jgi:hypothetical protein
MLKLGLMLALIFTKVICYGFSPNCDSAIYGDCITNTLRSQHGYQYIKPICKTNKFASQKILSSIKYDTYGDYLVSTDGAASRLKYDNMILLSLL